MYVLELEKYPDIFGQVAHKVFPDSSSAIYCQIRKRVTARFRTLPQEQKPTQPYMPDIDYSHAIFHYLGYIRKIRPFKSSQPGYFCYKAKVLRSSPVQFFL